MNGVASDSITITGEDAFLFDSFDVGTRTGGITYTITGYDGTTKEFSATGTDNNAGSVGGQAEYTTYSVSGSATDNGDIGAALAGTSGNFNSLITSLVITESAGSSGIFYLDNVQVASAPEPSSLFLLGTGLIGLGLIARRRFAL